MENSVNINRSLSDGKVVYNYNRHNLIKYILLNFISFLLIGTFIFVAIVAFKRSAMVFCAVVMCFVIWLITNRITVYRLSRVTNGNGYLNCSEIIDCINTYSNGQIIQEQSGKVILIEKVAGVLSWGRLTTIIFGNCCIYINIQTLLRGGTPSPYHGIINYFRCQHLKNLLFVRK